jgi:site-specific DNA-methyltransferase (adenine-specific)
VSDPESAEATGRSRRATTTSAFGVGRREGHDASDFYARFTDPVLSTEDEVRRPGPVDWIHCGDARALAERVQPSSVALVVTSPPYFAGKAYEQAMGEGHIPGDYQEYLRMLHDVFAACVTALEPGGRIAVNVANLGRKPYRSLAADVIRILQDDLGLLLRGEIVWRKGEGATGSCAWGSFQNASNPVLRDLTERVVVASKGRFDRAVDRPTRARQGLPHRNSVFRNDFMAWTTDVWDVPTESAVRVGHPAPFPVELPQRLIELYTYVDDVVLDPFMGSGSTAVAAVRTRRHYVGFDTDEDYVRRARGRAAEALEAREGPGGVEPDRPWRTVTADPGADGGSPAEVLVAEALATGTTVKDLAKAALTAAGFTRVDDAKRAVAGVQLSLVGTDPVGVRWHFELAGHLTKGSDRAGLRASDTLLRTVGKGAALAAARPDEPGLVVLTTDLPAPGSPGAALLREVVGEDRPLRAVVHLLHPEDHGVLAQLAGSPGR